MEAIKIELTMETDEGKKFIEEIIPTLKYKQAHWHKVEYFEK